MARRARALSVLALLLGGGACTTGNDSPTPTEVGCLRIDGAYSFRYEEPGCGRSGGSDVASVAVNQVGCRFNAVLPGYALLDGVVDGSSLLFSVTYLVSGPGCGNVSLSGSGEVTFEGGRTTLRGSYGSREAPPGGCACLPAAGAATFTLR